MHSWRQYHNVTDKWAEIHITISSVKRGQNTKAKAEAKAPRRRSRSEPWDRGQVFEAEAKVGHMQIFLNKNTWRQSQQRINLFVSHIFVMQVAMTQPGNGYNKYYFALDLAHFSMAKLTRPRSGQGQMLEAEANLSRPRPKFCSVDQRSTLQITMLTHDKNQPVFQPIKIVTNAKWALSSRSLSIK